VYWFDCINWTTNPSAPYSASLLNETSCNEGQYNNFFNSVTRTVAGTDAWIAARPQLVAGRHYIKDFSPVINYDFDSFDRPPGGFGFDTWYDNYSGRFMRNITVSGGDYTFITTSDDGVRVRVDALAPLPATSASPFWNVIENWTWHGRTINIGTRNLAAGSHQVTMEWFEGGGQAVAMLQVGTNRFSFSDSPRAGVGGAFPVIRSVAYGNSSLLLDGVINLTKPTGLPDALWTPRLEYYTLFWFHDNIRAATEVSDDGGFNWIQDNLANNCPTDPPTASCDPNIWGWNGANFTPANGYDWIRRAHDLRGYSGRNLGIRFRLDTDGTVEDGWWITDITVNY
jgi:hypothetical protein